MQETATSFQILVSLYLWQLNVSKVDEGKVGENMQVKVMAACFWSYCLLIPLANSFQAILRGRIQHQCPIMFFNFGKATNIAFESELILFHKIIMMIEEKKKKTLIFA
jgi:hypothetical protein